jgi:hypothetical protein
MYRAFAFRCWGNMKRCRGLPHILISFLLPVQAVLASPFLSLRSFLSQEVLFGQQYAMDHAELVTYVVAWIYPCGKGKSDPGMIYIRI